MVSKANDDVNLEDLHEDTKCFLEELDRGLDFDIIVTSGYRGPDHPIEAAKKTPGEHSSGLAADIALDKPWKFLELVREATKLGCKRIGISRKSNFVHVGLDPSRPTSIWVYT